MSSVGINGIYYSGWRGWLEAGGRTRTEERQRQRWQRRQQRYAAAAEACAALPGSSWSAAWGQSLQNGGGGGSRRGTVSGPLSDNWRSSFRHCSLLPPPPPLCFYCLCCHHPLPLVTTPPSNCSPNLIHTREQTKTFGYAAYQICFNRHERECESTDNSLINRAGELRLRHVGFWKARRFPHRPHHLVFPLARYLRPKTVYSIHACTYIIGRRGKRNKSQKKQTKKAKKTKVC